MMSLYSARARVAALSRTCEPDDPRLIEARRLLKNQRVIAQLDRIMADLGLITEEEARLVAPMLGKTAPGTKGRK